MALWLIAPGVARAERELRIRTLPETPLAYVTPVTAPAASCAAVSDAVGALVAGHRPESAFQVSVVRLDAQGQPVAGEPVPIVLPKPATLANRKSVVLGIACHPRFPLAYIWQDVEPPPDPMVIEPALSAEFDHLFIYSLEEPQPKLLLATARGPDFHCGDAFGGFALDTAAARLYVPNMQQLDAMKKPVPAIGWISLDPDGLPAFDPPTDPAAVASATTTTAAAAPTPPKPPVQLDVAAALAARSAKLAAVAQATAAGKPLVLRKTMEVAAVTFGGWPSPFNYAPISDSAVLLTNHAGPVSWVLDDRLGRFGSYYVNPYIAYRYRVSVHPKLPAAYVTYFNYDGRIVRLEHADGYLTMTPQALSLDNVVSLTAPLVLARRSQIVVGAAGRICVVALDDQGRLTSRGVQMTVNNPKVEALAWSDRFDRLYVPVEKKP